MTYSLTYHSHDVLVIGAGGAGLRAAIAAADKGARVAVVTKVPPFNSHTAAAQGGINAALGNVTPDDWRWHAYDTVRGSDWLGDQDAIAYMCRNAPEAIHELEEMGVPFSRDEQGNIYQRAYGGMSTHYGKGDTAYRACAAADHIGNAMMKGLTGHITHYDDRVDMFVEVMALDLLQSNDGAFRGVLAWELATGEMHVFLAHSVILATGGYGQVYAATTSASAGTGDGCAMALRAGLPLQDMEYVQFHPTGLHGSGILISEAARGEGGYLLNCHGERFMKNYAPKSMELASRDVVAREIMYEIAAGRGCGEHGDHVLLDISHLDPKIIEERLPTIQTLAKWFAGVDLTREPVPVLPTMHYSMGGLPSNRFCEVIVPEKNGKSESTAEGLMVIGEASCNSIHGANRLGCNSLLDLVVFGKYAGIAGAENATTHTAIAADDLSPSSLEKALSHFDRLRHAKGETPPEYLKAHTQKTMQTYCGILREEKRLTAGHEALEETCNSFRNTLDISDNTLIWNNNLVCAVETENILQQAQVVIATARARTESRGAHFRTDHPERDDTNWLKHSIAWLEECGTVRTSTRPVRFDTEMTDLASMAPEDRDY